MTESLQYFRPGEETKMVARCQFGIGHDGRCSAIMTYPIKGYPWRRNPRRIHEFQIEPTKAFELFTEIRELKDRFPDECLTDDVLWSDHTEAGSNAITRNSCGITCHTIYIFSSSGSYEVYYSLREDSPALLQSKLFTTITDLIAPFEIMQNPAKTDESRKISPLP